MNKVVPLFPHAGTRDRDRDRGWSHGREHQDIELVRRQIDRAIRDIDRLLGALEGGEDPP